MIQTTFKCRNGRTVTIRIDEDNDYCATVLSDHGDQLGKLEFREDDGLLKLVWAYLDESDPAWCRQGIGREILRQVKDASGCQIFSSANDGMRQDDGSQLTGDAPASVSKIREEKLILPGSFDHAYQE